MDTADTSPADGAAMDQSETSRPEPMDQPEAAESTSQSAPGEAGTVEEQPKMQPEAVTAGSSQDSAYSHTCRSMFKGERKLSSRLSACDNIRQLWLPPGV